MGRNKAGQTMSDEHNSSKDRYNPQTEKILRQFLSLESVNANSKSFHTAYDDAFKKPLAIQPEKCADCDFVAATSAEWRHHMRMMPTHHFTDPNTPHHVEKLSRCLSHTGGTQCDLTDGHEGLHRAGQGKSWGL